MGVSWREWCWRSGWMWVVVIGGWGGGLVAGACLGWSGGVMGGWGVLWCSQAWVGGLPGCGVVVRARGAGDQLGHVTFVRVRWRIQWGGYYL